MFRHGQALVRLHVIIFKTQLNTLPKILLKLFCIVSIFSRQNTFLSHNNLVRMFNPCRNVVKWVFCLPCFSGTYFDCLVNQSFGPSGKPINQDPLSESADPVTPPNGWDFWLSQDSASDALCSFPVPLSVPPKNRQGSGSWSQDLSTYYK